MQPHLLYLVHRIPYPPTKGDKVRSCNLLKFLASRFQVHLGAFVDDEADWQHAAALKELCVECHLVRLNPVVAKARSLLGLASGQPLTLPYYRNAGMQRWVREVLRSVPIQGILVFSAAMAQYVMSAEGVHRVADLVDVDSDKWRQYALTQAWPYSAIFRRESRTLLEYERHIASRFDATVFVSADEAGLFRQLAPEVSAKVWHVSNGVDSDYFSPERTYANPYSQGDTVLTFTGAMDYWPNIDAVAWFAREVFPGIRRRLPAARFCIVGSRPAAEVTRLAGLPGVTVTGSVPDIRPYLAHASLAVAPLRIARGLQNKVLEAMAMAKPVLASPQAAEGIEAQPGKELLIAVDDADFVRQALQLLETGGGGSIGISARSRVVAFYSWERTLGQLEELLSRDLRTEHGVSTSPASMPPFPLPPGAVPLSLAQTGERHET
ncbi:MAG: TIGR03087 family PEP-CTERM/XrtA system glycosyltransferase [Betaproteobacteria bacterium]